MKRAITCYGFCPTQGKETEITVIYVNTDAHGSSNRYIRVAQDCEYASFIGNECPHQMQCPLLAQAPPEKIF